MPKANSNPAEIQKLDRKRQVLTMLRQGFDIRAIAEQVDLDEVYVRTIAREEMQYLDLATQEMQQHFVAMTFARSERIMSRIMPDFDIEPPAFPEDPLDKEAIDKWRDDVKYYRRMIAEGVKNWALVTRVQKEVLQVRSVEEKKDGINIEQMAVANITITAESDFYKEALNSMQTEMFGESFPEMQSRLLEEGDMIQLPSDDRLSKIEQAIEKINATPETTDDA